RERTIGGLLCSILMTATSKILPESGKRLLCSREITRLQCLPARCKVACDLRITERSGSGIRISTVYYAILLRQRKQRGICLLCAGGPDRRCPAPARAALWV